MKFTDKNIHAVNHNYNSLVIFNKQSCFCFNFVKNNVIFSAINSASVVTFHFFSATIIRFVQYLEGQWATEVLIEVIISDLL